ncbi:putative helicase mov-10-B.1 isoform X2 [Ptiloglossa arizonensis]
MEAYEKQLIMASHNLKNQLLTKVFDTFCINVPTLNTDNAFVTFGDIVKLQNVRSKRAYFSRITDIEKHNIYVSLLRKNNEQHDLEQEVNVYFYDSNFQIKWFHYVLHIIYKHNLVNLLYPKLNTNYYTLPQDDLNWICEGVAQNPEQKQAVINILHNSAHPAPYIVFGPPGTGKTTTLVETIYQIRNRWKSKKILICASSNVAADEISKRLLALLPSKDIFRMYARSTHWNNVNKDIKSSSNFIDNAVLFLSKEIFILKKIVIVTLMTCVRFVSLNLRKNHFSYIFIDEASQTIELETLIPFTLTSSKNDLHAQIIIAGDPYQLGPVIHNKKIEHLLGKSMLERLLECEPYQKVENKYNSRYITKLVRNYRSRKPIIHISNKLFYDNELLCYNISNINKLALDWSEISNKTFPILFLGVDGNEKRNQNKSVYNKEESMIVAYYINKLMQNKIGGRNIQEKDIGVITPFAAQNILINKYLNSKGLKKIICGTVERFQGLEKEIIILSTVRSKSFNHNGIEHIGFLSNAKRFNVALTRAKCFLIVIGNPSILCKDECWKHLWEYCDINNACSIIDVNLMRKIIN